MKRLALLALTVLTACSTAPEPAAPTPAPTTRPPLLGAAPDPLTGCYTAKYTMTSGGAEFGRLVDFCLKADGNGSYSGWYPLLIVGPGHALLSAEVTNNTLDIEVTGSTGGGIGTRYLRVEMTFPLGTPIGPPTTGTFFINETGSSGAGTVLLIPDPTRQP
ncbi:hypothetical protein E7T06_07195 [Deinococcus sp. Arct2-2]|uniref:hypothetical protein n=1 Tax=Deinococcus sp. Arct2-2 TaxID=2568653 RepID=UPI0010A50BD6|nr:hypothetical protein [Deinococcus sp. Arct2-2]THF70484.1 hypothetical protein E7T06_07195 [Deinococcus sp. Arct2-2]